MSDWYKMHPVDWNEGTDDLTLEQEAAYLRICHAMYITGKPIADNKFIVAGLLRCNDRKAQRLLAELVNAGKLTRDCDRISAVFQPQPGVRVPLPTAVRLWVIERDGERCTYCGDTDGPFEVDHIHPVALGGTDVLDNLTCACRRCNRSKGASTLQQWGQA
jgi:5-methylcytosine-specific restriction endonuclease McrA